MLMSALRETRSRRCPFPQADPAAVVAPRTRHVVEGLDTAADNSPLRAHVQAE
jgi:hypothetical protein